MEWAGAAFRIRYILILCSAAAVSLTAGSASAQNADADGTAVMRMHTTAEYLDPQERISGGAALGVAYYDPADSLKLDAAFVYFAQPVSAALEMQLATIDGRYVATFDYVPEEPVSGWLRLDLSLSQPEFLNNYDLSEIALLMTNAETGTAYPIRWGKNSKTDLVRIQVNTEGANSYFVVFDSATEKFAARSCQLASKRSSFKFDRICDLPVADVVANDNEIEIVRKRGAGFGKALYVTVLLKPRVSE